MRRSPSIVPQSDDQDIYLVLDDFGARGRSWRETDEGDTDRATVIRDLFDGQYYAPARVIAFNTVEGWSRDVSEEIADELARGLALRGDETPAFLEEFLDRHASGQLAQLPLPLRGVA
jgi:hypothetical protein